MAEAEKVENLVLGGGEAGKHAAWELMAEGLNVRFAALPAPARAVA